MRPRKIEFSNYIMLVVVKKYFCWRLMNGYWCQATHAYDLSNYWFNRRVFIKVIPLESLLVDLNELYEILSPAHNLLLCQVGDRPRNSQTSPWRKVTLEPIWHKCLSSCPYLRFLRNAYPWDRRRPLTTIKTWIRIHMASKVWDEITYPFPNFNDVTVRFGNG